MPRLNPCGIKKTICSGLHGKPATLRGDTVATRIMDRLSGKPKARAMAAKVVAFYGDCLQYHESPDLASSLFEIRLKHDPVGLRYARIELRLGTDRIAEAMSHELLHLRLGMLGYPMGEKVWIPHEAVPYAYHLMSMQAIVSNLLHHELIFEAFLDLGFKEHRFLAYPEPPPDYEALARNLLVSVDYAKELGFPWWCLEYFRHWLSLRHGYGEQSGVYANNAIYWASRLYPDIAEATQNMRRIVESGVLRSVGQYPNWANKILELMRMPIYTQWVRLNTGRHGPPTAVTMRTLAASSL